MVDQNVDPISEYDVSEVMKGPNNCESLVVCDVVVALSSIEERLAKATASDLSLSSRCMRTEPIPMFDASVQRINSFLKSGNARTGALHKACLRIVNAFSHSSVHANVTFRFTKIFDKLPIKFCKANEALHWPCRILRTSSAKLGVGNCDIA